jgi:hypothetical protein
MMCKFACLLFILGGFCCPCSADENDPVSIFKKTVAAYGALDTYSDEGKVDSDIISSFANIKQETTFSIKLKRPNMYSIQWDQKNGAMPMMSESAAVWSDGEQPYLYMSPLNAYSKMKSDQAALGGATGISAGAASTIPSFFVKGMSMLSDPFDRMIDPKLGPDEKVEDDDCYVITGGSKISKSGTYWISKKTFFIRKYSRSLEPPEGGFKMPEMTDAQIEEWIKSMGGTVTDESKQRLRDMMKQAQEAAKNSNLKGAMTETHNKISSPHFNGADFDYQPPATAVLKDSLFGSMLNSK